MTREQKYMQIVHFIEERIASGEFAIGDRIPSVNSLKIRFKLSRSSVFLAMDELKSRGLIEAEPAVGYFVISDQIKVWEKVLLLFNEFNPFKEKLYKSFLDEIGEDTSVDILFHNFNKTIFETLLKAANGKYTTYVLMPGKFVLPDSLLKSVRGHIILLDHFRKEMIGEYSSIGQDFDQDTYNALKAGLKQIKKYKKLILIQKAEKEPEERYEGIKRFCEENGFAHELIQTMEGRAIEKGDLYITAEDSELVLLLKRMAKEKLSFGTDLGIISYNETEFKEILAGGITTLSTDFENMGRTLAHMVKNKSLQTIHNPCTLTIRNSI